MASPYPKLKLRISRKPDAQPVYVHCNICRLTERRWTHSDDRLPVCGRCRSRERAAGYQLFSSDTYHDLQHVLAGLALVRAIHETAGRQPIKDRPHG